MAYDVPDLRVLVYAADTGARRDFPKRHLQSAEWSDERYGGWKEFSLSLAADVTELTITPADKVEIYWQDVLRYRGWVTQIERMEGDPPSLKIQGNGLILQAGRCLVQRPYVYAGSVDVAQAFRDAASDAVAPVLPDAVIDAQDVGATLTVLEATNKPFIEALNGLAEQAQNLCLFGGDVDDDNADRLYFKPFNVATDYTLQVPGLGVTGASAQTVSADLANRVKIIGGNAQDPNLIYNSSFERPRFGGEGVGNLLHDPSFENNTDWSIGSGGSRKQKGGQEGQPYHGSYMVEVDNSGEYAQQTQNPPDTAITVGHDYTFSLWAKCESEADAVAGTAVLTWLTSGGSTISTETITLASPLSGSTPRLSATWQQWKLTSRAPATAAGFKVRIECTSGGGAGKGILADLVEVYDSFVLYQDGWELTTYGSAVANVVNWVYKDPAGSYDGAHCVYVDISATDSNGQDAILQPLARQRFAVLGGATYIVSVWLKSPPGITSNGKIQLELWEYKSDGSLVSGTSSKVTIAAGSGWSDWTQYTFTRTVAQTATHAMVYLCFRGNSKVLIDGFCMRGSAAGTTYIREGQYEEQIDVTDGDLTGLESGVADSIDDYGIWDEVVRVDSITNRADALSYAAAFFNARAVPLPSPFVEIAGPADQFRPGELVRLLGAHGTALMGGQSSLPIVRARWSYDGILRVRLEMKRERPNMAEEIVKKLRKQLQPPAAVTYSQGVAGTASGTGGGGGAPVTPGGSDGDVQYNNGSAGFAGESVFNYDATDNQLSVPGLSIGEDLLFNNVLRPTSLTTDTHDYEPTNWATGTVFCINATGDIDLTGLEAATDGQVKILINTGATTITLVSDSSSSTAGNRFLLSADVGLLPEQGVILLYEDPPPSGMTDTLGRWRAVHVAAADGVDGEDGALWYTGSGAPDGGTGVDGDLYLRTSNGDVYQKASGTWGSPIANLTGPAGADGADGEDGAAGADGRPAGFLYNFSTTTSSGDPGSGSVRFNHGTYTSITAIYLSETDADGRNLAAEIATWDDSSSAVRAKIIVFKVADPTIFLILNITGESTDNGSWVTLTASRVAGSGTFSASDSLAFLVLRTGDKGEQGPEGDVGIDAFVFDWIGTTGDGTYDKLRVYIVKDSTTTLSIGSEFASQGGGLCLVRNDKTSGDLTVNASASWSMADGNTTLSVGQSALYLLGQPGGAGSNQILTLMHSGSGGAGADAGFSYTYSSTTTSGDPGSGKLRFNHATLSSATAIYLSETDAEGNALAAEIATWDDSTSTVKGTLKVWKTGTPATFAVFQVSGSVTDNGSWDSLALTYVTGAGSLANDDPVTLLFVRTGDAGTYPASPTLLTPSQLTGNQSDWSPTSLSTADLLRIDADRNVVIPGLDASAAKSRLLLVNPTAFEILLPAESASATTAANRFATRTLLYPGDSAEIFRDATSARWRVTGPQRGVDPASVAEIFEHFLLTSANGQLLGTTGSGGSAGISANFAFAGHPGVTLLGTGGSSSAGYGQVGSHTSVGIVQFHAGSGRLFAEAWVRTPSSLSDATDTYTIRFGFTDNHTADPTDGIQLLYSHGTNSGKWQARTRSNSSESTADSGITVAASTWYLLRCEINAAGSQADFYIDRVRIASITTNIPTGTSRVFGFGLGIFKSVGTATREMFADYVHLRHELSTAA